MDTLLQADLFCNIFFIGGSFPLNLNRIQIIDVEGLSEHAEVISFNMLDEMVFLDLREGKIKRYAESFAEVSCLLLDHSKNIQFIDPYFSSKNNNGNLNEGFVKSFRAMLEIAGVFERSNFTSIKFHTSYKHGNTEVNIDNEKEMLDAHYRSLIPSNQQIEFIWWNDVGTGEIHPRYLVTEKGGIRFDRGFIEPASHEQREAETDVSMMTTKMNIAISQKYREESSSYKVVDRHIVQGIG